MKNTDEGYVIILQTTHGLLAGKIANQLHICCRNQFWSETFTAITEHDDQQLRFKEKDYLNNLGVPLNFTENNVSNKKVLKHAKRIFHKSLAKSKWIGLMVYLHMDFLYSAMDYKPMQAFLKKHSGIHATTYQLYGTNKKEAEKSYQVLRFCDRLSLILCLDEIPSSERELEINTSIANKTYKISQQHTGGIIVVPWCFQEDSFELSVEKRFLKQAKFGGNQELKEALKESEVKLTKWKFIKSTKILD